VNRIDEPEGERGELTAAEDPADDLERATENVLEGWPAPRTYEPDGELDEGLAFASGAEASAGDELEAGSLAEPDVREEDAPVAPTEEGDASVAAGTASDGLLDASLETSSEHAPGQLVIPPGYAVLEGTPQGRRRAVGIVVSRFNGEVTGRLLQSALDELAARGVGPDSITVMPVPGAFELPIAAMALAKTRRFACIVALGCVIRGDTPHFDYVASEAASGLQLAALETGVPVAFGVLTLDRPDQAEPRFAKGAEAVGTALEMADLFANLRAAAAR
jgi:6,7-dimethyl-8-ribityllumazine synthase